jgi:hypothetical protein
MARRRRQVTTAAELGIGDVIIAPNGYQATVDDLAQHPSITEPHVSVHWTHPHDFTVNGGCRGQSSGRIFRPGDPVTRWVSSAHKA